MAKFLLETVFQHESAEAVCGSWSRPGIVGRRLCGCCLGVGVLEDALGSLKGTFVVISCSSTRRFIPTPWVTADWM